MNQIDIEGIRAREQVATPGPWEHDESQVFISESQTLIASVWFGDTDFISHARQDIPALLDALDKKDAEISKLSQDVEHLRALLDRAVEEIKRFGSCQACGHNAPSEKYPVLGECEFGGCNGGGRGSIEEDRWQWRGFSEREG